MNQLVFLINPRRAYLCDEIISSVRDTRIQPLCSQYELIEVLAYESDKIFKYLFLEVSPEPDIECQLNAFTFRANGKCTHCAAFLMVQVLGLVDVDFNVVTGDITVSFKALHLLAESYSTMYCTPKWFNTNNCDILYKMVYTPTFQSWNPDHLDPNWLSLPEAHTGTRRRQDRVSVPWVLKPKIEMALTPVRSLRFAVFRGDIDFMSHFFYAALINADFHLENLLKSKKFMEIKVDNSSLFMICPTPLLKEPKVRDHVAGWRVVVADRIHQHLLTHQKAYRNLYLGQHQQDDCDDLEAHSGVEPHPPSDKEGASLLADDDDDRPSSIFITIANKVTDFSSSIKEKVVDTYDDLRAAARNLSFLCSTLKAAISSKEIAADVYENLKNKLIEIISRLTYVIAELAQFITTPSKVSFGFMITRLTCIFYSEAAVIVNMLFGLFKWLGRDVFKMGLFSSDELEEFGYNFGDEPLEAHMGDPKDAFMAFHSLMDLVFGVKTNATLQIVRFGSMFTKCSDFARHATTLHNFYDKFLKDYVLDMVAFVTGVPRMDLMCPTMRMEVERLLQDVDKLVEPDTVLRRRKQMGYHQEVIAASARLYAVRQKYAVVNARPEVKTANEMIERRVIALNLVFKTLAEIGFDYDRQTHPEPCTHFFEGLPGVGKSTFVKLLTQTLLKQSGREYTNVDDEIYRRQSDSDYWSGYKNQFCCFFDDFGMVIDSTSNPNPNYRNLMEIYTDATVPLNMAGVSEKASTFFTSPIVIGTVNKLAPAVSLICPDAMERRIDIMSEIFYRAHPGAIELNHPHQKDVKYFKPCSDYAVSLKAMRFRITKLNDYAKQALRIKVGDVVSVAGYMQLAHKLQEMKQLQMRDMSHKIDKASTVLSDWLSSHPYTNSSVSTMLSPQAAPFVPGVSQGKEKEEEDETDDAEDSEEDFEHEDIKNILEDAGSLFTCMRDDIEDSPSVSFSSRMRSVRDTIVDYALLKKNMGATAFAKIHAKYVLAYQVSPPVAEWFKCYAMPFRWLGMVGMALTLAGAVALAAWLMSPSKDTTRAQGGAPIDPYLKDPKGRNKSDRFHYPDWRADNAAMERECDDIMWGNSGRPTPHSAEATETHMLKNTQDLFSSLTSNMYSVYVLGQHSEYRIGNLVFLKGNVAMMFAHGYEDIVKGGGCRLRKAGVLVASWLPLEALHVVNNKTCYERDLIMFAIPTMRMHRDITNNFITEEELCRTTSCPSLFLGLREDLQQIPVAVAIHADNFSVQQRVLQYNTKTKKVVLDGHLSYAAPILKGDCGGLIVADHNAVQKKIFGIHLAGYEKRGLGYGCTITSELITNALNGFDSAYLIAKGTIPNLTPIVACDVVFIDQKQDYCVAPTPNTLPTEYTVEGTVPFRVAIVDSAITKSPIHGMVEADGEKLGPHKFPAKLKVFSDGEKKVYPLELALEKNATPNVYIPESLVKESVEEVFSKFQGAHKTLGKRVLTNLEAAQGIEGIFAGVDRSKSAGYPKSQQKDYGQGKYKDLGRDNEWFISDDLEAEIAFIESEARANRRVEAIFIETLKDERRPPDRVKEGKTRLFSASPLAFLIVFRKYFMPFITHVMNERIKNGVAVGMNVYQEWEQLVHFMQSKGTRVTASDFKSFDASLQRFVLWCIGENIIEWFDDAENETIRRVIWSHITDAAHIVRNFVFYWSHGLPSGNPITAIVNSIYVLSAKRMAWKITVPAELRYAFDTHIYSIAYGDDNMDNMSDLAIQYFNHDAQAKAFAKLGMTLTSEDKDANTKPTRLITEVTFLKRSFVHEQGRWICPIDKLTIEDMVHWVRKNATTNETFPMIVSSAFREASLHPKSYYDKYTNAVVRAMKHSRQVPNLPTKYMWDTQRRLVLESDSVDYDF